jgi:hypothetical protein
MPRRPNDLTVVGFAVGASALLAVATATVSPSSPPAGAAGSSFSAAPEGGRAAFLLLGELGRRAERSYEPLAALRAEPARTTLVLANPAQAPSEQDRRALARFVDRGGIVLATGRIGAMFLGVAARDASPHLLPQVYGPIAPSALASGAPSIAMQPETGMGGPAEGYLPVYGSESAPVVQAARIGEGLAIWWAGATPLTNGAIARESNVALLLNALGGSDRRVIWDEFYHGHSRSLWSYLSGTPLAWAGAQALLLALAAAMTWSRRRGPVRSPVVAARTSPMEFVETLGGLYGQGGAASAAVASAAARLRRELIALCGMAADCPDNRLATAAASRAGIEAEPLRALLVSSREAARDPTLRAAEALPIVQRLQAMTASVVGARRR